MQAARRKVACYPTLRHCPLSQHALGQSHKASAFSRHPGAFRPFLLHHREFRIPACHYFIPETMLSGEGASLGSTWPTPLPSSLGPSSPTAPHTNSSIQLSLQMSDTHRWMEAPGTLLHPFPPLPFFLSALQLHPLSSAGQASLRWPGQLQVPSEARRGFGYPWSWS